MKFLLLYTVWLYLIPLAYTFYDYENPYGGSDDNAASSSNCEADQVSSRDEESCCFKPTNKSHTKINCISYSPTCWVVCDEGYWFPDVEAATQLIECKNGTWMAGEQMFHESLCQKNSHNTPSVENPEQELSGVKVSQETERKKRSTCEVAPRISNAVLTCSWTKQETEWVCTATCKQNHFFRNGHTNKQFINENEEWKPVHSNEPLGFFESCFSKCKGKKLPPEETIGTVQFYHKRRGNCTNTGPVLDMAVCEGLCPSSETYSIDEYGVRAASSNCTCCRPTKYRPRYGVEFTCDVLTKPAIRFVEVPTECHCAPCSPSMAIAARTATHQYTYKEENDGIIIQTKVV